MRLVNADTNQEIMRCDVGDDTMRKAVGSRRVMLLAKVSYHWAYSNFKYFRSIASQYAHRINTRKVDIEISNMA